MKFLNLTNKLELMESNREKFLELRAEEFAVMYDHSFSKKDAISTGKNLVNEILEKGEIDPKLIWANICRLKEVVNSADAEFRNRIEVFEKLSCYGVEFNHVNGGNTINYTDDEIYCQLKEDLDARVELLKLSQKQTIIDAFGNDVPKVSITPRKSSITVKF